MRTTKHLLWCLVFACLFLRQEADANLKNKETKKQQKAKSKNQASQQKIGPSYFGRALKVFCISPIFFSQWICWIWLFELKLMIVLLSAPSSPVQNRRLLSARNARMSSIEMPDDNEKSVSSASTSPCHSPVNTFAKYVTVFLLWSS